MAIGSGMRESAPVSVAVLAGCLLLGGCSSGSNRQSAAPAERTSTLAVRTSSDTGSAADDGQWTMPARNYASTRYSGLNQITTENVKQLQVAWTFSTGLTRSQQATP